MFYEWQNLIYFINKLNCFMIEFQRNDKFVEKEEKIMKIHVHENNPDLRMITFV